MDDAPEHDEEWEETLVVECVECGHVHFYTELDIYLPCPIEECGCPFAEGTGR
jgi:hypothetical protein